MLSPGVTPIMKIFRILILMFAYGLLSACNNSAFNNYPHDCDAEKKKADECSLVVFAQYFSCYKSVNYLDSASIDKANSCDSNFIMGLIFCSTMESGTCAKSNSSNN